MISSYIRRKIAIGALQFWDLTLFLVAITLANTIESSFDNLARPRVLSESPISLGVLLFFWHFSLRAARLYISRRLSSVTNQLRDIVYGTTLGAGFLIAFSLLFGPDYTSLHFIELVWAIVVFLMIVSRLSLKLLLTWLRIHKRNLRFAMIVGSKSNSRELIETFENKAELGYEVVGCVLEHADIEKILSRTGRSIPVLGALTQLPAILAQNIVDEVFVALPVQSHYINTKRVIEQCKNQGIPVRLLLEMYGEEASQVQLETFGGKPIILIVDNWDTAWYSTAKRMIDLFVAVALLLVLSPWLIIIGILVKLDSQGPAIFTQDRVGLNKRIFKLYKFRSMVTGSEKSQDQLEDLNEADGPVFKISNDPRITRIGKFLRPTSIDEFPQLLNVIKGDMSLVGPRPLPIRDVKGFSSDWQRRRFSVLPGITCLWQISGRSDMSFEQWMKLDMEYIDNASFLLDLKIALKTIVAVIKRSGAY